MDNILIVLFGSGKSEIGFIQGLLERIIQGDCKQQTSYEYKNLSFIIAHPQLGSEHKGGKDTFKSSKPYEKALTRLINYQKVIDYQNEIDYQKEKIIINQKIYYIFLGDSDISDLLSQIKEIEANLKKYLYPHFQGEYKLFEAKKEFESWFIAGLGEEFKKYHEIKIYQKFDQYLNKIEDQNNTKETLEKILINLKGPQVIGYEFGLYLDIQQAKKYSKSFEEFMKFLEIDLGLNFDLS